MKYLDLIPNDVVEIINKKLIDAQNNERRNERKKRKNSKREKTNS
jgi:hypothetical protein